MVSVLIKPTRLDETHLDPHHFPQLAVMEGLMDSNEDALDWLEAELTDSLDEDYELEMSDPHISAEVKKIYKQARPPGMDRREYFRQLLLLFSPSCFCFRKLLFLRFSFRFCIR